MARTPPSARSALKTPTCVSASIRLTKTLYLVVSLMIATSAFAQDAFQSSKCNRVVQGEAVGQNGQHVAGLDLTLEPLGVDFDYVLPRTKTDQMGRYRFENICLGRFTVFIRDDEAGYLAAYHVIFLRLTSHIPEVRLTAKHLDVNLRVDVPPKPGLLDVRATSIVIKAGVPNATVVLKLEGRPNNQTIEFGLGADTGLPVPPDRDVLVRLKGPGFWQSQETGRREKVVHIPSGTRVTLEVHLAPRKH